jgi:hypothetical protein
MPTTEHYPQQIDEGALIGGRYRLSRWLGLGAVGEVWAARDERLGRDVAVKLILRDPNADSASVDLFTREAIAIARINHRNVVAVYDQGNWGWVSAVDIAGGADNQPEPGLPYCGS